MTASEQSVSRTQDHSVEAICCFTISRSQHQSDCCFRFLGQERWSVLLLHSVRREQWSRLLLEKDEDCLLGCIACRDCLLGRDDVCRDCSLGGRFVGRDPVRGSFNLCSRDGL